MSVRTARLRYALKHGLAPGTKRQRCRYRPNTAPSRPASARQYSRQVIGRMRFGADRLDQDHAAHRQIDRRTRQRIGLEAIWAKVGAVFTAGGGFTHGRKRFAFRKHFCLPFADAPARKAGTIFYLPLWSAKWGRQNTARSRQSAGDYWIYPTFSAPRHRSFSRHGQIGAFRRDETLDRIGVFAAPGARS